MKQLLLIITGLVFASTVTKAQVDIEIMRVNGNHSINDSTITISGNNGIGQYSTGFFVTNTGNSTQSVKCKWLVKTAVPNTSNQICWVACFGASSSAHYVAPTTATMSQQGGGTDTNTTFVGYFNDSGKVGTASIYYIFYNSLNANDSAWVLVNYNITNDAGIAPVASEIIHFSAPYPNPAGSRASFNYHVNSNSHLTVYNSIGQSVNDLTLKSSESRVNLNVADMPSGLYICKLSSEGAEPVFQKLIVTH